MAPKRKSEAERVLELLWIDSYNSEFEKEFSDSVSEKELMEEDDHYSKKEQEWSSSEENNESNAGDSGESVICEKSGLEWKETAFCAKV